MAGFCNTVEKLTPPSFVTTPISSSNMSSLIGKWSVVVVKSEYRALKDLLLTEISHLTGYIERKGIQLRLEKALMLTKQIQKICHRWEVNDFFSSLIQFQKSMGDFDKETGYLRETKKNSTTTKRLPSTQWTQWVLYVAMRDVALLAKICIECENTITFWFGLIASGHHWSDSLIICGILSRIWYLSSKMTDDMIHVIYPALQESSCLVTPNKSASWPREFFNIPSDLLEWIHTSLNLPFRSVQEKEFLLPSKWKSKKGVNKLSFLADYFLSEQKADVKVSEIRESMDFEVLSSKVSSDVEDFGIVVQQQPRSQKKIKSRSSVKQSKQTTQRSEVMTWKNARTHWRKFFVNFEKKLGSEGGRKMLVGRIKRYRKVELDEKLKKKLLRLKKLVLKSADEDMTEVTNFLSKLEILTRKHVRKLKNTERC